MICVIKRDRYFLHLKMHSFSLVLTGTLYFHQYFTKSRCFPVFLLPERKRDCGGCDGVQRCLPFCIRRAGLRDCRRWRAGHVSAQEWRWDKRSCGIYPWCQTSLIHKCCAGGSGPVSCQVWSHFGLTSADIGLKWLQTRESKISEEFLVSRCRKWNVSRWTIKVETFENAAKHFKIYKNMAVFPCGIPPEYWWQLKIK